MDSGVDASAALDGVSRVRARTRLYRNGHWFASLVFGLVVLGALPFYARSTHCHTLGHHQGFTCSESVGPTPLGRAFMPHFSGPLGSWSTLYWAIAIVVGFAVVVAYYHLRARKVGVQGRLWPAVVAGLVILGLVMWVNDNSSGAPSGDFLLRGTSILVVIAIGLLVLSGLERSHPFVLFAAGFLALAVLSCLYTVVNLFQRLGIGGPFRGSGYSSDRTNPSILCPEGMTNPHMLGSTGAKSAHVNNPIRGNGALPNLVLPGAYLVIGGLAFLLAQPWRVHVQVHLARTEP